MTGIYIRNKGRKYMVHSKKLDETAIWKEYEKKAGAGSERCIWVKKVYEYAANYLKDVRRTFENYTLHDETHILNVLDAMGGLLGDQISNSNFAHRF